MIKYIHTFIFAVIMSLCFTMPAAANEAADVNSIENQIGNDVSLTVTGQAVRIVGANGLVLDVYNVVGVKIASIKVEGNDKHFDLNLQKGCYILKVGKVVRKVSFK